MHVGMACLKYVGCNARGAKHVWQLDEIFVWWKRHYRGVEGHGRNRCPTTLMITKEA